MGNPWFKFYPQDWLGDECLSMCSLPAQGLWVRMMCIMHKANPYGFLLVNGQPLNNAQLARLNGEGVDQINQYMTELENAGVYSVDGKGRIYSRRMVGDAKKANIGKKHAKKRWGQTTESKEENPLPNGVANGDGNGEPITQKPEARSQIPDTKKKPPCIPPSQGEPKKSPNFKRGSRLESDWVLPDEWGEWALGEGMSHDWVCDEWPRFRDYWIAQPGSKGVKLDWYATWRNWVRNAKKFAEEKDARKIY